MKHDAEVQFTKAYPDLGIKSDDVVIVPVDDDYVDANEDDIIEYVGNELEDIYGASFCYRTAYEILNMEDLIDDISSRLGRYGNDDEDGYDDEQ